MLLKNERIGAWMSWMSRIHTCSTTKRDNTIEECSMKREVFARLNIKKSTMYSQCKSKRDNNIDRMRSNGKGKTIWTTLSCIYCLVFAGSLNAYIWGAKHWSEWIQSMWFGWSTAQSECAPTVHVLWFMYLLMYTMLCTYTGTYDFSFVIVAISQFNRIKSTSNGVLNTLFSIRFAR